MLTYREEFKLYRQLSQARQDALIDLLEQVQSICEAYDDLCLDTPAEGTPERILFEAFYAIQNTTYAE